MKKSYILKVVFDKDDGISEGRIDFDKHNMTWDEILKHLDVVKLAINTCYK